MSQQQFPPYSTSSIHALSGSMIREVANSGMGRNDVIPFWFGESDQVTPEFIREEAIRSLSEGNTFYSQNLGRPYLREEIARYLSDLHGTSIGVERVAAISSGVTGLMIASELLLEPNDKVVAVTPLWPNLTEIPKILRARIERVSLTVRDQRWTLDVDRLIEALSPDTRVLLLNSPNNPTGWMIDEASIPVILEHCRKYGIWIICDDVYERLVYDLKLRSAPSFLKYYQQGDRIISVNSFSKAWRMTGWRAGWIVVPETLSDDLAKIIEYNFSCMFEPVQRAATVALQVGESSIQNLREELVRTRTLLSNAMSTLPNVEIPDAGGAMYLFFRISGFDDSLMLAKRLVNEVGLGLAPGAAFGSEGEGWLRWCHAVHSGNKLLEGVDRLATFIARA